MSSRPHTSLFESTRSALLLPRSAPDTILGQAHRRKANLDKNFWILRELGRVLVLVDNGAGLPDLSRFPRESPYECFE